MDPSKPPKKPLEECARILQEAEMQILAVYRHIKSGNLYQATEVTLREADLEPLVIYKPLLGLRISFSRPLKEFQERFQAVKF